jgi:hypothetical protein
MDYAPTLPDIQGIGVAGTIADVFPIVIEISPMVLVLFLVLASIFLAIVSVILVYHWRRFPFEHELFRRVERVYTSVLLILGLTAAVGILLTL